MDGNLHSSAIESPTLVDALGGRSGIGRLVHCFFDQMEHRPSASGIRSMHGADLEPIAQKLTVFLYQHMRTPGRKRSYSILPLAHFSFSIGQ